MLKICKELYSNNNLIAAVQAYVGIANIRIEDRGCFWYLYFNNCRYGTGRTIKEFENYLIGLENR